MFKRHRLGRELGKEKEEENTRGMSLSPSVVDVDMTEDVDVEEEEEVTPALSPSLSSSESEGSQSRSPEMRYLPLSFEVGDVGERKVEVGVVVKEVRRAGDRDRDGKGVGGGRTGKMSISSLLS